MRQMKMKKLKCLVILTFVVSSNIFYVNGIPNPNKNSSAEVFTVREGKVYKSYKTSNTKGLTQSQTYPGIMETSFSNRDTYVNAANDYGYNVGSSSSNSAVAIPTTSSKDQYTASSINSQSPYQNNNNDDIYTNPTAWYYQITPNYNPWTNYNNNQNPSYNTYSGGNDLYEAEDSGYSGGWLCRMFFGDSCDSTKRQEQGDREGTVESLAALGIFGVVALVLKKIGLFKIVPLLPIIIPLLPFLLPILLIIGLPLFIAAFFLPIFPVVVIGRSLQLSSSWARSAKDAFMKEDCVERITCEASRFARGYGFEAKWIDGYLKNSSKNSKWIEKIAKARNADCKSYTCHPVSSLKKALHFKDE